MNVQSHVEILRLHCEHLRTLIDHVLSELTTTEQVLATKEHPSFAGVALYLHGVEKQCEHIAAETVRLQGFTRSLVPQSPDTGHVVVAL
jgi:hypothetical protein